MGYRPEGSKYPGDDEPEWRPLVELRGGERAYCRCGTGRDRHYAHAGTSVSCWRCGYQAATPAMAFPVWARPWEPWTNAADPTPEPPTWLGYDGDSPWA